MRVALGADEPSRTDAAAAEAEDTPGSRRRRGRGEQILWLVTEDGEGEGGEWRGNK